MVPVLGVRMGGGNGEADGEKAGQSISALAV